jgi:hypothetical protein
MADTQGATGSAESAKQLGSGAGAGPSRSESDREALLRLLALGTARTRHDYLTLACLSDALTRRPSADRPEWTESDTAELNALLTEYTSLRQESMNTINNRVQILVLGLAAIGALAGVSVTSDRLPASPVLLAAVFSGAIPVVCVFVFMVWLSEAIRCHRIGYHIASAVEARINAKLERLVVTWEAALWTGILKRDEMWGPSMVALALVGLVGAAAPWCGVFLTGTSIGFHGRLLWEVWFPYAFFLLAGLYGWWHLPQLKNIPVITSSMHAGGPQPAQAGQRGSAV